MRVLALLLAIASAEFLQARGSDWQRYRRIRTQTQARRNELQSDLGEESSGYLFWQRGLFFRFISLKTQEKVVEYCREDIRENGNLSSLQICCLRLRFGQPQARRSLTIPLKRRPPHLSFSQTMVKSHSMARVVHASEYAQEFQRTQDLLK